jgi:hypothetical protein
MILGRKPLEHYIYFLSYQKRSGQKILEPIPIFYLGHSWITFLELQERTEIFLVGQPLWVRLSTLKFTRQGNMLFRLQTCLLMVVNILWKCCENIENKVTNNIKCFAFDCRLFGQPVDSVAHSVAIKTYLHDDLKWERPAEIVLTQICRPPQIPRELTCLEPCISQRSTMLPTWLLNTKIAVELKLGLPNDSQLWLIHYPRQRQRIFLPSSASSPALGPTQPPVQWVPGDPFPGGKARPGRDADHSSPSSSEVNKWVGAIPPLPPKRLYGV